MVEKYTRASPHGLAAVAGIFVWVFWIMTQIDDRAQNATITRLNDTL
jgi:hypothetical protein